MKRKNLLFIVTILALSLLFLVSCGKKSTQEISRDEQSYSEDVEVVMPELIPIPEEECGKVYLYGEEHANGQLVKKELEQWQKYYNENGMRHLFVELPYYAAQSLNLWMQAENDELLNAFFADFSGTNAGTPIMWSFYKVIKETCPETIFHGTDVGHSYDDAGVRYIDYLENSHMKKSEEYTLAQNCIAQGKYYMRDPFFNDDVYREEMMAYNFARELASLNGENVMGIYGAAHIDTEIRSDKEQNRMAARLIDEYSISISTVDLRADGLEFQLPASVSLGGLEYETYFLGESVVEKGGSLQLTAFMRLWNAEYILNDYKVTGETLLSDQYPTQVETGEVYLVVSEADDGEVVSSYYRVSDKMQDGLLVTEEIVAE